ncbi:MAG: flagellar filament capping protein FliD [Thermodesulfovibrionales bacterium]|nr:flagellar filament capping protein FliD [Thermodesulfovibrionales bacterium]
MNIKTVNPFNAFDNPFKPLQTSNKAIIAKYLATKDMQEYQSLKYKQTDAEIKITSYSTLMNNLMVTNDLVNKLKSVTRGIRGVLSSNTNYVTATANIIAGYSNYNIQIKQIAKNHEILSTTFSQLTDEVADLSTYSEQKMRIKVGSNPAVDITINSSNNSLEDLKDTINDSDAGVTAVITAFDVTNTNNKIRFKVGGTTYTANIETGSYSGEELANKIRNGLTEAYNQGVEKFSVTYDKETNKFSILNKTGADVEFLWDDAESTAYSMLGFSNTPQTVQNNKKLTSDETAQLSPYRLKISADNMGADNKITIEVDINNDGTFGDTTVGETTNAGLGRFAFNPTYDENNNITGGIANMTQHSKPQNAILKVNGKEYSRTINNISDIISGVTLNLIKPGEDYEKTFRLSIYPLSMVSDLNVFVNSFNATMNLIEQQKGTPEQPGALHTDTMLNNLDSDLRSFFVSNTNLLAYLGLKYTSKGTLQYDETGLKNLISRDANTVAFSLTSFSSKLSVKFKEYIEGTIPQQKSTYEDEIKDLEKRQNIVKGRLKIKQIIISQSENNPLNELLNQPQDEQKGLLGLLSNSVKKKTK